MACGLACGLACGFGCGVTAALAAVGVFRGGGGLLLGGGGFRLGGGGLRAARGSARAMSALKGRQRGTRVLPEDGPRRHLLRRPLWKSRVLLAAPRPLQ